MLTATLYDSFDNTVYKYSSNVKQNLQQVSF